MKNTTCKVIGILAIIIGGAIIIAGFFIGNYLGNQFPTVTTSYLIGIEIFNTMYCVAAIVSCALLGLLFVFLGIILIAVSQTIYAQGYITSKQFDLQHQIETLSKGTSQQLDTSTSPRYDADGNLSVLNKFISKTDE